jgi:pimeloyl-[acyl-carrier protein] methyl ester esterase
MANTNPRLVLLPGMDGTGLLLEDFANALPASLRPLVVRYPPDVGSYRDVDRFLRSAQLDSEPFVLLGESFSSVAAIAWAATNPPNLRGLVICVGFATPPLRRWLRPVSRLLSHLLFALPRPRFLTRHFTAGRNAPKPLVLRLETIRATVPVETFAARIRAILSCDVRRELNLVRVPILFLHAEEDRLISRARLEEMRQIQPHAAAEIFPGPHLLLERHAVRAAERVARFVRECANPCD